MRDTWRRPRPTLLQVLAPRALPLLGVLCSGHMGPGHAPWGTPVCALPSERHGPLRTVGWRLTPSSLMPSAENQLFSLGNLFLSKMDFHFGVNSLINSPSCFPEATRTLFLHTVPMHKATVTTQTHIPIFSGDRREPRFSRYSHWDTALRGTGAHAHMQHRILNTLRSPPPHPIGFARKGIPLLTISTLWE